MFAFKTVFIAICRIRPPSLDLLSYRLHLQLGLLPHPYLHLHCDGIGDDGVDSDSDGGNHDGGDVW